MISKSADISSGAKIGKNVKIGAFTVIEDNVVIGDGTWVGPNVTIMNGARIGENCQIFPGAVISAIPQDLKFIGEETTAEIGDNCIIREHVTFNRGTKSKGKTTMGNNCLVMANAHVGHDCTIGNNCIIGFSVGMAGEVEVQDWANISGMSGIHQFVKIGAHTMIEGLSKIVKDIPPFIKAGQTPLSFAGLNVIGLKRRGFSSEQIHEIHEIYRTIYLKGMNVSQAVAEIEATFAPTLERETILKFIKESSRGIIKSYVQNLSEEPEQVVEKTNV